MVEVTQADRDAAAATLAWALAPGPEDISHWKAQCCVGEYDDHHILQAFAAHRLAVIAEGRRQMREEAALAAMASVSPSGWIGGMLVSAIRWRTSIVTAIRAIPIGDE